MPVYAIILKPPEPVNLAASLLYDRQFSDCTSELMGFGGEAEA